MIRKLNLKNLPRIFVRNKYSINEDTPPSFEYEYEQMTGDSKQNFTLENLRKNKKDNWPYHLPEMDVAQLTEYEVSKDIDEFKNVERLLDLDIVPLPKTLDKYPTPSGWIAPNEELSKNFPYYVRRTKYHMLPIYESRVMNQTRSITRVRKIDGDIEQFRRDLIEFLEKERPDDLKLNIQMNSAFRQIKIRGHYAEEVSMFLLQCGF
ncbi:hypothetical protein SNEBB_003882 [Seison nebaliae]|nr:hypothetical protein SNEBB_003882 [Seison nebaliae]